MQTTRAIANASCALVVAMTAACGGGGADTPESPGVESSARHACEIYSFPCPADPSSTRPEHPVAVFGATISDFPSPDMLYVFLDDGQQLAIVGRWGTAGFAIEDLITVTLGSWSLDSSLATYNSTSSRYGTSYLMKAQANSSGVLGTMARPGRNWSFAGTSLLPQSTYRFGHPANLAALVGGWSLTTLDGQQLLLMVSDTGAISGTHRGCPVSGAVEAARANNYFAFTMKLLGSCEAEIPEPFVGFLMVFAFNSGPVQLFAHGSATFGWEGASLIASGVR